ncbi:MAG: thiamine diphosphokinase [Bacteroidales bacterium]|nr:thiamine diphosphokinase [Bacteroidales bacterium]
MEERKHIVILAAGDFPSHPVPLRALREADFVVCCDSAYEAIKNKELRIKNYVVIGDGDSLSATDKAELGDRYIQVDEQDYNDLHKAMAYATAHYPLSTTHYTILGATGRREDHTLGNISYLVTFAEEHPGAEITMLTNHGCFCAMTGSRTFSTFPRQQVSIFTMNPDQPIHSDGLRWPLDGFHARRWWQASLNEALGTEFSLRTEGWLVVFQTYAPKE